MRIFLSWSGERSRAMAEALYDWLSDVFHNIKPWMSTQDIDAGGRWSLEIANMLQNCRIGIICITRDNIYAPWLLFETGALAKTIEDTYVCPYLLDLKPAELHGPLVQFQSIMANENDTRKLLHTINKALGHDSRTDDQINRTFNKWWPQLEERLANIPLSQDKKENLRSDRDILEEILTLARSQMVTEQKSRESSIFGSLRKTLAGKNFFDAEVDNFSKKIAWDISLDDPNDLEWFNPATFNIEDSIDGNWFGRWNGGIARKAWESGTAIIKSVDRLVYILYSDRKSAYLIVANKDADNRLVGRYINFNSPYDSTPWVGTIVNNKRIDGKWVDGRWDFRR